MTKSSIVNLKDVVKFYLKVYWSQLTLMDNDRKYIRSMIDKANHDANGVADSVAKLDELIFYFDEKPDCKTELINKWGHHWIPMW